MPTLKKRVKFFETEEGMLIEKDLERMLLDGAYNTQSSYSADGLTYPDHVKPFVQKHKDYLNSHPGVSPTIYIQNLRLMTRLRK